VTIPTPRSAGHLPQLAGAFFVPAEKESKGCLPPALGVVTDTAEWSGTRLWQHPAHCTEMTVIGRDMLANPGQFFDLRATAISRAAAPSSTRPTPRAAPRADRAPALSAPPGAQGRP